MVKTKQFFNLQTDFLILICVVIVVSLSVTDYLIVKNVTSDVHRELRRSVLQVAKVISHTPVVIDCLSRGAGYDELKEYVEDVRDINGMSFIVVHDMADQVLSLPDNDKYHSYYEWYDDNYEFGVGGDMMLEDNNDELAVRAFTPVYDKSGRQVGVVLVGIVVDERMEPVNHSRRIVAFGSMCGLFIGILIAVMLADHIKTMTFGMEPVVVARMFEERNAILESVREGIMVTDRRSNLTLINAAAIKLFDEAGIRGEPIGKPIDDYIPNMRMKEVMASGRAEYDQEHEINGVTIMANCVPVFVDGEISGVVTTFRDKTELAQLVEKLTDVRVYAGELRSRTHEFMNKLQVVLGMIHMEAYDELKNYVRYISEQYKIEAGMVIRTIKDPVIAGFLLGKLGKAREEGVKMSIDDDSYLPDIENSKLVNSLVTILGNLIDNAMDAVSQTERKKIKIKITCADGRLHCVVNDTGAGIAPADYDAIWEHGYSSKGEDRGIGLYMVKRAVNDFNGELAVTSEVGVGTEFAVILPMAKEVKEIDKNINS